MERRYRWIGPLVSSEMGGVVLCSFENAFCGTGNWFFAWFDWHRKTSRFLGPGVWVVRGLDDRDQE